MPLTLHIGAEPDTIKRPVAAVFEPARDDVGPLVLTIRIRNNIVPVSPEDGEHRTSIRLGLESGTIEVCRVAETRFAALPVFAGEQSVGIVVDWPERRVGLVAARANADPLFLINTPTGEIRLVSGVGNLRAEGEHADILPHAVNFFLGFGHSSPGNLLYKDIHPLYPGCGLTIWQMDDGGTDISALRVGDETQSSTGLNCLPRLHEWLTTEIRGKSIAVVSSSHTGNRWLSDLLKTCGATKVTIAPPGQLSLSAIQTAMIVHTGQPHSDPALLASASAAVTAANDADLILLDWGLEGTAIPPAVFDPFTRALASRTEVSVRSLLGGFLKSGLFVRDYLFNQICAFSDEERFLVLGPRLLREGFGAMADQLGTNLETAIGTSAMAEMSRIDRRFRLDCTAVPLLFGLRSMIQKPVLAPFLNQEIIPTGTFFESGWVSPSTEAGSANAESTGSCWADDAQIITAKLNSALHSNAKMFRSGLVAKTPSVRALTMNIDTSSHHRTLHQQLTLLGLEKWLKTLRSVSQENRDGG